MRKAAILQSNYIPWKGYFDLINSVDEFIFYDIVQYTKNDWRNRNKIKTPNGVNWITIPVKHTINQRIDETVIQHQSWARKNFNTFVANYRKAACFDENVDWLKNLYSDAAQMEYLCDINYLFINAICKKLNIQTKISSAQDYEIVEGKTERLVHLCKQAKADVYLSGSAAKDYLNCALFEQENMQVEWANYSGYQEYTQLFSPFEHGVTILDLIFNTGKDAGKYLKSCNTNNILNK
jgi:hypothetical protein